jgi:hypothetical protein
VPFVSYEIGSERVATVNCPNCGVQRPVAIGVCPNCLMSTAPSGQRLTRGLVLAGAAVVALMTIGYLISRRTDTHPPPVAAVPDSQPSAAIVDTAAPAAAVPADTMTVAAGPAAVVRVPAPGSEAPVTAPPTRVPAPPPSVAVSDTGRWEYAMATTWVRVRGAPTRESEVLRMVDSAQRVRLGPPVNGWRPIRVGVDRGWVDPRLFTVIPPPASRP